MRIDVRRACMFAAVLAFLAGYLFVFRPAEATIAERYAQIDEARAVLQGRLAAARRAPGLIAERRTIEGWLLDAGAFDDRATAVDHFLRIVTRSAQRDDVRISSVIADTAAPSPASATAGRNVAAFEEIPLTISLRGTYIHLLHLIGRLDASTPASQMTVDSLVVAENIAHVPELGETLHVRLLRAR